MRSLIGFHILHIRGQEGNGQRKDAEADDLEFSNLGFFNFTGFPGDQGEGFTRRAGESHECPPLEGVGGGHLALVVFEPRRCLVASPPTRRRTK